MNDHVLLNISTVTGKWFRKFVFNFDWSLHVNPLKSHTEMI